MTTHTPRRFFRTLYFRVIVGIVLGVLVGIFVPHAGEQFKPLGDVFIKLIRMMITPVIFFTVVIGIANIGSTRRLGRVGVKALVYFEVVTTFALLIGLAIASIFQPGKGMNVNPATLDMKSVAEYASDGKHLSFSDFILNIIPDSFGSAFAKGEVLQVLLLAILCGLALISLDDDNRLVGLCESISQMMSRIIAVLMELAPFGAFGAMAFTIGKFGLVTLLSLGKLLLCVYLTSLSFIFIALGLIC